MLGFKGMHQALLMLIVLVLGMLRQLGPTLYPSFWAEDGTYLFRQSLELGVSSLWTPIVGHYHTIPRLVAWFATYLPLSWAPAVYSFGAAIMCSFVLTLFSRREYRWLVPSDRVRAGLSVILGVGRGTLDTFYGLTAMNYIITAWILLLLLQKNERGDWKMSWGRAGLISFLWFSAGQGVVLVPLLLVLFWVTRRGTYLVPLLPLAVSIFLNLLDVQRTQAEFPVTFTQLAQLPRMGMIFIESFYLRFIYGPVLGFGAVRPLVRGPDWFFLLVSAVTTWWIVRRREVREWWAGPGRKLVFLSLLCVTSQFVLIVWVRHYGMTGLVRPHFQFGSRYSLLPSVLIVLSYGSLLYPAFQRTQRSRWLYLLAGALVFNQLFSERIDLNPHRFAPLREVWSEKSRILADALAAKRAGALGAPVIVETIPCRPDGWGSIPKITIQP